MTDDNPYRAPAEYLSAERGDDELVRRKAERALAFALLGLFCCGFVFGPLAIRRANEAEALRVSRNAGDDLVSSIKTARDVGIASIVVWVGTLLLGLLSMSG